MNIKLGDLRKIKSIQKFQTEKKLTEIKKRATRKPSGLPRGKFGRIKVIDSGDVKK